MKIRCKTCGVISEIEDSSTKNLVCPNCGVTCRNPLYKENVIEEGDFGFKENSCNWENNSQTNIKFCQTCGAKIHINAVMCPKCGCKVNSSNNNSLTEDKPIKGGGLGFVLVFFLSLIGYVIALMLGDDDCKHAANITFVVSVVLSVLAVLIFACTIGIASA